MKLLLMQNMRYLPSHGGANRSNRLLLEELAARGHTCTAVGPLAATTHQLGVVALLEELGRRGIQPRQVTDEAVVFNYQGVEVHVVIEGHRLAPYARELATQWTPDWVLVPSDDPGQLMLATAQRAAPGRVVYLVHTLQQLPFGPRTFYPSQSGTRLVSRAAGVIAVSQAARDYVREHADLDTALIYPQVYGEPPFPQLARRDGPVLMVNPCSYKGLSVLLGLARACPEITFHAVPTWGTTSADRTDLSNHGNIRLVDPVDQLTDLLTGSSAVLMPSLWDETFGYTAVEAMLHGVPVLASEVGGLSEAKLGVPYLLPVRPIEEYHPQSGDEPFPEPVVPPQDVDPWVAALRRLLSDPEHYDTVSRHGRDAASGFVTGLDPAALETYLGALTPASTEPAGRPATADKRQAALARLLAQRQAAAQGPAAAHRLEPTPAEGTASRGGAGVAAEVAAATDPGDIGQGESTVSDSDLSAMLLIRHFEQALLDLFGRGELSGTTHTCLGQEYIPVAVSALLRPNDWVFSNHRGHGHYLARFDDPDGLLAEIMGRQGGLCDGVGGSQHLLRERHLSTGVQGESLPLACGAALRLHRTEPGGLACAYIGDGTWGEGAVYEALNLAALWRLPLLVVVEHNGIAQTTPTAQQLAGSIGGRAAGFGVPHLRVEGSDVPAIRAQLAPMVEEVRARPGPLVVEFATHRLGPHSKGDDTRSSDELAAAQAADWYTTLRPPAPNRFDALDQRARDRVAEVVRDVSQRPRSSWSHRSELATVTA